MVRAKQHNKRERLCRIISRPAVSEPRLSLTAGGKVRYQLKMPYSNGTTLVVFETLDFLAGPVHVPRLPPGRWLRAKQERDGRGACSMR